MGACLCGLGNSATPNRPPDQGAAKTTRGGMESSKKPIKTRKKKQYSNQQENREELDCNIKDMCKVLTLEDLIMASPGFNRGDHFQSLHMHHRQSSKKIHPSFDGDCKKGYLHASCSAVEMLIEAEEGRNGKLKKYSSGFTGEKSRKLKKKVSFRSPEVAQVFVIHSPEFELRNLMEKESITI